jgi:hypothetical protein
MVSFSQTSALLLINNYSCELVTGRTERFANLLLEEQAKRQKG